MNNIEKAPEVFDFSGASENKRSKKKRKIRWIARGLIAALILIIVAAFFNVAEITEYTIVSDKIDEGFKIALITDLHCTSYGKEQQRLISSIKAGKPDIILLGGDIFHHHGERESGNILIAEAVKIAPVYFVPGNHEEANPEYLQILEEAEANGAIVLNNQIAEIEINGNPVILAGGNRDVFSMWYNAPEDFAERDDYKIALNHFPDMYTSIMGFGFDMMLSGHAHGGQVRIPLLFPQGLYTPGQGKFPKYTGGLYEFSGEYDNADFKLIVSRGLSKRHSGQFRVFNRPELVFVTVTSSVLRV
ncbi:MAG: metallophosphoesterase [Oscillospiraceae bacterium]|nr:metallophosphoesterase [Oscillospiraceae bacterium]